MDPRHAHDASKHTQQQQQQQLQQQQQQKSSLNKLCSTPKQTKTWGTKHCCMPPTNKQDGGWERRGGTRTSIFQPSPPPSLRLCCVQRYTETLSGTHRTPCLSLHEKYVWPATVPLFFPRGRSSSTPHRGLPDTLCGPTYRRTPMQV